MMMPVRLNKNFILANLLGLNEKLPPGVRGGRTYRQMTLFDTGQIAGREGG